MVRILAAGPQRYNVIEFMEVVYFVATHLTFVIKPVKQFCSEPAGDGAALGGHVVSTRATFLSIKQRTYARVNGLKGTFCARFWAKNK